MLIQFVGSVDVDVTFLLAISAVICCLMAWVPCYCGLVELSAPNQFAMSTDDIGQEDMEFQGYDYPESQPNNVVWAQLTEQWIVPTTWEQQAMDDHDEWVANVYWDDPVIQIWDNNLGQHVYMNEPPVKMAA